MSRGATGVLQWRPGRVAILTSAIYLATLGLCLTRSSLSFGALIHVGRNFVSADCTLYGVPVFPGGGYDGQFFYRLALEPRYRDDRICPRLDAPAYRQQRILYPFMVWALSFGEKHVVPFLLVAVNFVFVTVLGWVGAKSATQAGRPAYWGLLLACYPGFLFSILHDTPEPIGATLLVGSLFALRIGKPILACVALVFGVLVRESLVPAAIVIAGVWAWGVREKGGVSNKSGLKDMLRWWVGILPVVAFLTWQTALAMKWRQLAFIQGRRNVAIPVLGTVGALWESMHPFGKASSTFDLALLAGLIMSAIIGVSVLKGGISPVHEKVAFAVYGIAALSLGTPVWEYRGGFLRALSEFYALSFLLITSSRWRFGHMLLGYWIALFIGSAVGYCLMGGR